MKENKLIAEFLGWELQDNPTERWYGSYREPNGILHKNTDKEPLLFHTSWDWLMPVVQKIESLGYVFTIQGGKAEFGEMISKPQCFTSKDKISSTYDAVVEFINQLNKES